MVFPAAFAFGAMRVRLIAPQISTLAALAPEVPLILCLSWIVAGRVLCRWQLTSSPAPAMGALAFVLLRPAEFAPAYALSHQTSQAYAATFLAGPGALGLGGQTGLALIPALRTQTRG